VFFAVLTGCGKGTIRDCATTLAGAVEAGAVDNPIARDVLKTIIRSARIAERLHLLNPGLFRRPPVPDALQQRLERG
jgi:hypothetical protein